MQGIIDLKDIPSLYHKKIDKQHRNLIKTLNKLYILASKDKGSKVLLKVIKFLERYTEEHFSTEEKMFKLVNFPEAETHLAMHNWFKKQVKELKIKVAEDNSNEIALKIVSMLNVWFLDHIKVQDKKYAKYISG